MRRLGVDGDALYACGSARLDVLFGVFEHEVRVEGDARQGAQVFHDLCAEGEVGDKVSVHEVEVEQVGTGCGRGVLEGFDSLAERRKGSRQERGSERDHASTMAQGAKRGKSRTEEGAEEQDSSRRTEIRKAKKRLTNLFVVLFLPHF